MKKILFLTNIPAPYRTKFFNLLGKKVELTVLYEKAGEKNCDNTWYDNDFDNYQGIFMEKGILSYLRKNKYDYVFNCNYSSLNGIKLALYCKLHRIPLILEVDGGIAKKRNLIIDFLISKIMKLADYYFSTSVYTDEYFNYYHIKNNIYHYHFSSLTRSEISENKRVKHEGFNILAVGQMIHRKGFDLLLQATKEMNVNVTIIGGEPPIQLQSINPQAKFIKFLSKKELNKYYANADLFVLPSREEIWGLVLNEAISFNIPIISSDNCVAGKEFINNYQCGLLFANENVEDLKQKINEIILKKNYDDYVANCDKVNMNYNLEQMVADHYNFIRAKK